MPTKRPINIQDPNTLADLPFESITVDERLKLREGLTPEKVEEYAEILQVDPAAMPPLVVGTTDPKGHGPFYLVDGFHRLEAQKRAGMGKAFVEKKFYPDFESMFEEAFRRNDSHGIHLTPSERRKALETIMLAHPDETLFELATRCGVSKSTIGNIRKELSASGKYNPEQTCKGRDGKERPLSYKKSVVEPRPGGESVPTPETLPTPHSTLHTPHLIKCAACGKTAPLEEAHHFKSSWEPDSSSFDPDSGRYTRWFCCEDCQSSYLERVADDFILEHDAPINELGVRSEELGVETRPGGESDAGGESVIKCECCGKVEPEKKVKRLGSGWLCFGHDCQTLHWFCDDECLEKYRRAFSSTRVKGHGLGRGHGKDELESHIIQMRVTPASNFVIININGTIYEGCEFESLDPVMMEIGDSEYELNDESVRRLIRSSDVHTMEEMKDVLRGSLYRPMIDGPWMVDEAECIIHDLQFHFEKVMEEFLKKND